MSCARRWEQDEQPEAFDTCDQGHPADEEEPITFTTNPPFHTVSEETQRSVMVLITAAANLIRGSRS